MHRTISSLPPDSRSTVPASLAGCRVLVVGLGRFGGGVGVTRWLVEQRANVTVTDQADAVTLRESTESLAGLPVTFRFGPHHPEDLRDIDLVVMNPAVDKRRSDFFAEIVRRGIAWTTEMNLFCERCPAAVVGVTGSFGKSTTCAMLAEVLTRAADVGFIPHRKVYLGGNIGRSLLPELTNIRANDLVVLEMSNAQLEDLPRIEWTPAWSVITNLFPHHLDRHGTFEAYANAKLNILRERHSLHRDDPRSAAGIDGSLSSPEGPEAIIVGDLHPDAEPWVLAAIGKRIERLRRCTEWPDTWPLKVPGTHNRRNAACVLTLCEAMSIPREFVQEVLDSFTGLPHRLQHVGAIGGVDYFNDSKSTSPAATIVALESFSQSVVVILGGQVKEVELGALVETVVRKCRAAICTGAAGPQFAAALRAAGSGTRLLTVHEAATLEEAVRTARSNAQGGDAILFSPGAPSFDRYVNFEARGRHFIRIVDELAS